MAKPCATGVNKAGAACRLPWLLGYQHDISSRIDAADVSWQRKAHDCTVQLQAMPIAFWLLL